VTRTMPSILTYPTGGEYREALYNTRLCFKDPALIGGNVTMDDLGMPRPISGAFGSVFNIQSLNGQKWAVKCFTRFVNDQAIRYQHISETLQTVNEPWRMAFEYLPDGILSKGRWYPALKMEWVDATGLISFVEKNLLEPDKLSDLAVKFARMVSDLSALGIAHGDLQHGNLLVTSKGELKLIDYDGMFVPTLTQIGACEIGHRNYQSPARTMASWGPYLDNFSAWIIYASLVALSIDPALWILLHDEGDEALIFNHDDFAHQQHSRAVLALTQSSRSDLRAIGSSMSKLWTPDMQAIPYLDPTILPTLTTPGKNFVSRGPILSSAGTTSTNASGTTADLVMQGMAGAQIKNPSTQGDISWITGHLARLPMVEFNPSRTAARLIVSAAVAAIVAVSVLDMVGFLSSLIAGASAFAIFSMTIAATILLFRKTHEWRAKYEKVLAFKECKAKSSKAAREVSQFERVRRAIDNREQKTTESITKEAEKAKASELKELNNIEKRLAGQLRSIEKQKQRLQNGEAIEAGRALRTYQQQHVASYLSRASISSARIPGIGQGVVRSLAAHGIHSAADFTGLRYHTGPRGGQQIFIVKLNGFTVHPSGVGEKKARDLDNWRRAQESMARATQPSSLPTAQAQAIRSKYAQERQMLANQERGDRAQAISDQSQIKQKWATVHSGVSARLASARQTFSQERAQADLHVSTAKKGLNAAIMRRVLAEREVSAHRNVSYRRYLAGVIHF
jgi:hypothetical protein